MSRPAAAAVVLEKVARVTTLLAECATALKVAGDTSAELAAACKEAEIACESTGHSGAVFRSLAECFGELAKGRDGLEAFARDALQVTSLCGKDQA